ncbi:MAG: nuclear transport factor 2 family protein [Planctomycetales bacterium]|nr:nuclear transport factor 2 family protein [Planctomycetales bacterium]
MSDQAALLNLTKCLLESIVQGNWQAYGELCDPTLTCFESEAQGVLVEGMDFHRFYFEMERPKGGHVQTTLASPHVRMLGEEAAVVCYIRLTQSVDSDGVPHTHSAEETRVWHKQQQDWKLVHVHRRPL